MCKQVACTLCGKITWTGCGEHLDGLFDGVAQEDLCVCDSPDHQ